MSDELNKHRIPYAFLNDIKARFIAQYGNEAPLQQAIAFAYNEQFSPTISECMRFYNSDEAEGSVDNIGAVKTQINEVKEVMVQNIEKVLERGEKIELLVEKSEHLNQQALRFETSSRTLHRTMYWRQMRCYATIAIAALFLLWVTSASYCGGFNYQKCRHSSKKASQTPNLSLSTP
jgi:vesicle-associated membrane protein 7